MPGDMCRPPLKNTSTHCSASKQDRDVKREPKKRGGGGGGGGDEVLIHVSLKRLSCLGTKIRRCGFAMQAGKGFTFVQLPRVYIIMLNYTNGKSRQLSTMQTVWSDVSSHWYLSHWLLIGLFVVDLALI